MEKEVEQRKILSVVIPIYNGEKYLMDMINSVLNSTYENLDIILIDDGSSDDSPNICKRYTMKDKRIRYIRQGNTGIVGARNRGLDEAKGDYVALVDQDDLVSMDFYKSAINSIEQTKSDLCIASSAKFFRNVEKDSYGYEYQNDDVIEKKDIPERLLLPSIMMGHYMTIGKGKKDRSTIWNIVFKKKILEQYGIRFKRFANFEDDLLMRFDLLLAADKVCTISEIGYYWRMNYNSKSHNKQYVEKIDEKWKEVCEYIVFKLEKSGLKQVSEVYRAGAACNEIVEIYSYEVLTRRKLKERKVFLENVVISRLTPEAKKMIDQLDKTRYLDRGILRLVAKHQYLLAFFYAYIFTWLRNFCDKVHITDIYKNYIYNK